jgi:hypothetical protein
MCCCSIKCSCFTALYYTITYRYLSQQSSCSLGIPCSFCDYSFLNLYNGYRVSFPEVKWHGFDHPPSSNFFFYGSTALYGPGPPRFVEVSWSHTFETHLSRYDSSGRVTSSSQRTLPDNTQHSQETDIHAPGGIRTHDPSKRAAADPLLRPDGHWDRPINLVLLLLLLLLLYTLYKK